MDREGFLARVAARLDMPLAQATNALDGLRAHLEDAAAAGRERGESPADAERRAVERMGDPDLLGRELTRAHRARRPLLAVIGGSVRAAANETARASMQGAILIVVSVPLGLVIAGGALHAVGRDYGSLLAGSVLSVLLTWLGFGVVGWTLPGRITDLSGRDHDVVRRVVALTGLVVSSLFLWLVVDFRLDDVLAVGLPLAPLAFVLVALSVPVAPRFHVGMRETLGLGVLLILPLAVLGVLTATPRGVDSWSADLASFGVPAEETWLGNGTVRVDWETGFGPETVDISMPADAAERLSTLEVEVWPVDIVDGVMRFGAAPLVTAVSSAGAETTLRYVVPSPQRPLETIRILVGGERDGTRIVIDQDLARLQTQSWNGTLARWWFGD